MRCCCALLSPMCLWDLVHYRASEREPALGPLPNSASCSPPKYIPTHDLYHKLLLHDPQPRIILGGVGLDQQKARVSRQTLNKARKTASSWRNPYCPENCDPNELKMGAHFITVRFS